MAAAAAAEQETLQTVQPSDCHILVVDDERISQVVVSSLLRKCNYKVTVAQGGPEAMQVLQQSGPGAFQLVLTDLVMPTCSGLDLLRFVRSQQGFQNLPVVMMSANQAAEAVCECISSGAEDFLVKPVTKKEVQNIWTHVVKRSRPGRGTEGVPVRLEIDPALLGEGAGSSMSAAAMAALSAMHRHLAAPMPEDHGIRLAAQAGITLMQHQQQQPQQPQPREHLQLHLEWQDEAQDDEDRSTAAADEDVAYGVAGAGAGAVAMEVDGPRASRTGARHSLQHQRQMLQQHLQQLGQSGTLGAVGAPGATFHAASLLGSGAGALGFGGAWGNVPPKQQRRRQG